MNRTLNFKTKKKTFLTITLPDEKGTTIQVKICDKQTIERFASMNKSIADLPQDQQLSEVYEVCAELMSHNLNGVKITGDQLEKLLDYEDLIDFVHMYREFINDIVNRKN